MGLPKRRFNCSAIEKEIKDHVDEIRTDTMGNLIAVKKAP